MALPSAGRQYSEIWGRWPGLITGTLVSGPESGAVGEIVNSIEVAVVNGNQQLTISYQNEDSQQLTAEVLAP